jgi:hypothetical protein
VLVSAIHRSSDFDATQADFEVRFDQGSQPERAAAKLYTEVLAPACSAGLLRDCDDPDWRQLPTIAVSGPRDTVGVPMTMPSSRHCAASINLHCRRRGIPCRREHIDLVLMAGLPQTGHHFSCVSMVVIWREGRE